MFSQITGLGTRITADLTGIRFLTGVGSAMFSKIRGIGKRQIADLTGEWSLVSVYSFVHSFFLSFFVRVIS